MSKTFIVLACFCTYVVIGAVVHPPNSDKAGNLSVVRHIDYQMRLSGNESQVGQANSDQLFGQRGSACNGETFKTFKMLHLFSDGGWYVPCDGKCYVFTGINTMMVTLNYHFYVRSLAKF